MGIVVIVTILIFGPLQHIVIRIAMIAFLDDLFVLESVHAFSYSHSAVVDRDSSLEETFVTKLVVIMI